MDSIHISNFVHGAGVRTVVLEGPNLGPQSSALSLRCVVCLVEDGPRSQHACFSFHCENA